MTSIYPAPALPPSTCGGGNAILLLVLLLSLLSAWAQESTPSSPVPQLLPSDYKLTGIASLPSSKWAFITVRAAAGAPVHYALKQGHRQGTLEVVEVDAKAGRVKIRDAGTELTLTLNKDAPTQADVAEKKFTEDHTRAHEERERKERERTERERQETARPADKSPRE
ncbi:MAG: hypothetical protein AB1705_11560 [Verrucomicrobiota bacterium]